MALSNTGKPDSVRFDKPQDWFNWSPKFKGKAKNLNLWDYINPDDKTPWPIRPTPLLSQSTQKHSYVWTLKVQAVVKAPRECWCQMRLTQTVQLEQLVN